MEWDSTEPSLTEIVFSSSSNKNPHRLTGILLLWFIYQVRGNIPFAFGKFIK